ncbi:hypothetical protein T492DRAFT_1077648 [Pavlovales sp. CCMP2436]|nr:hypothetical protein T492DRAFT_1077648 [Pavlovales sp. CCMP2436]
MALLAKLTSWYATHSDTISEVLSTTFHYGFIPFVIIVGMRTEPRPTLLQLIQPM